ncbi:MAG: carbohydrate ABC transporter permease [Candidatus Cloacimonadota bacterium]|nr:MAG: carbohydrate ABC transporter permease [Candidatus Cloacimonadota bacterium]
MFKQVIGRVITYTLLIICGLVMIIPFVWMVTTALKSQKEVNEGRISFIPMERRTYIIRNGVKERVKIISQDANKAIVHIYNKNGDFKETYLTIYSPKFIYENRVRFCWHNFVEVFQKVAFGRYFLNTIFISLSVLIGVLITSSLAAYAFARMKFYGRDVIFYLFISMMMVPQPVYLIPSFILLNKIGWIDTYQALIIPWIANIFTIFLLRQQFKTIPDDLFDAAAIDGCSRLGMLWHVALPVSKSVLVTSAIFSIIGSWNSFMWPLVMTSSENIRVLQVGLSYFSQGVSTYNHLLMAASTLTIAPLLILFLFAQRKIISSFAMSGLKG